MGSFAVGIENPIQFGSANGDRGEIPWKYFEVFMIPLILTSREGATEVTFALSLDTDSFYALQFISEKKCVNKYIVY